MSSDAQHREALWLVRGIRWMLDHPAESHTWAPLWCQRMVRYCLAYHEDAESRLVILVSDLEAFMEDIRARREQRGSLAEAGGGVAVDEAQPDQPPDP